MRLFARDCVLWTEDPNEDLQIDGEIFRVPSNKQNLALIHVGNSVDSVFEESDGSDSMLQPDDEKMTRYAGAAPDRSGRSSPNISVRVHSDMALPDSDASSMSR